MRVRVCVLFLSHEEKKESARVLSLFVPISYFVSSSTCWWCGVLSVRREARDTHARAQKKEREKREFLCGSKKRDFSDDDDDEGVYIFLSEKKMAQRSPRKSLQLNRANAPFNFSGPMQDVNVSSASFFF